MAHGRGVRPIKNSPPWVKALTSTELTYPLGKTAVLSRWFDDFPTYPRWDMLASWRVTHHPRENVFQIRSPSTQIGSSGFSDLWFALFFSIGKKDLCRRFGSVNARDFFRWFVATTRAKMRPIDLALPHQKNWLAGKSTNAWVDVIFPIQKWWFSSNRHV